MDKRSGFMSFSLCSNRVAQAVYNEDGRDISISPPTPMPYEPSPISLIEPASSPCSKKRPFDYGQCIVEGQSESRSLTCSMALPELDVPLMTRERTSRESFNISNMLKASLYTAKVEDGDVYALLPALRVNC